MRLLTLIAIAILATVVSVELYFLLASSLKIRDTVFQVGVALNPHDVMPQPIRFVPFREPSVGEEMFYFKGHIPNRLREEFDSGVVDDTYFPYYENGEIHPPTKYDIENNYSKEDVEKMKLALKTARRYADINKALAEGYRIDSGTFVPGMGIHVANVDYILDDKVSVEKPEFLTYIRNRENRRFQLAQMGFIAQRTTPFRLFEAKDAQGHFHIGITCMFANNMYLQRIVEKSTKSKDGKQFFYQSVSYGQDIFDEIEVSELVIPEDSCKKYPGAKVLGPSIWMMHFAINMYNEYGMFSDYFPYVDYLSANAITHSFFGEKL
ncbi:MAG: hypothetical protein O3A36_04165 [bacterium]|nr:hypothetical protein [bacterium]